MGQRAKISRVGLLAREDALALVDLRAVWFPSGHVGGMQDRAALAEREVRAILAETEPHVDGREHDTAYRRIPCRYDLAGLDAQSALAESLAAFVAQ